MFWVQGRCMLVLGNEDATRSGVDVVADELVVAVAAADAVADAVAAGRRVVALAEVVDVAAAAVDPDVPTAGEDLVAGGAEEFPATAR